MSHAAWVRICHWLAAASYLTNPADPHKSWFNKEHGPVYDRLQAERFVEWQLIVEGSVTRPRAFSLLELQRMPSRTQITRHTCEEGWSAIAQWTGVPPILAYGMNGRDLPISHGAPLRARVETQLGYKSLKFLRRIVVTDHFEDLGNIRNGWSWYAGI